MEQIYIWVAANAFFSAVGALLAFAHPFTILVSAIAAPITSLNPTIGAGIVGGMSDAWIRKPKVEDFEELPEDIQTMKGWRHNRVTRLLLVVIFVSLGSTVGTFVAIPMISKLLGS